MFPGANQPDTARRRGSGCDPNTKIECAFQHPAKGAVNRAGVTAAFAGRSILRRDETTMAEVFRANGYRKSVNRTLSE